MRYLLFTLILLFSLSGCQDKEQEQKAQALRDVQIAKQAREALLAEQKALQESQGTQEANTSKLTQMGITVNNGVITIDTNQTKDFFNILGKNISAKIKKMTDDFEKGIIETNTSGIEISEEHINIDLNKTKSLIEDWNKKIKVFIEEFDTLAKEIETNATIKGN